MKHRCDTRQKFYYLPSGLISNAKFRSAAYLQHLVASNLTLKEQLVVAASHHKLVSNRDLRLEVINLENARRVPDEPSDTLCPTRAGRIGSQHAPQE